MAKEIVKKEVLKEIFKATPHLLKFPQTKMWIDYDQDADVLYVSFKRPQKSTDSKMLDNGILLRYRDSQLVGITVLEASKRG